MPSPLTAGEETAFATFLTNVATFQATHAVDLRYVQLRNAAEAVIAGIPDPGLVVRVDEYLTPDDEKGYVVLCFKNGNSIVHNFGPETYRNRAWA